MSMHNAAAGERQQVVIVTPYGTANYGTNLQALGLAETLESLGYDARFFGGLESKSFLIRHPMLLYARVYNRLQKKKEKAFFSPVRYPIGEGRKARLKAFKETHFKTVRYGSGREWSAACRETRPWFAAGGDILWNPAKGYPAVNFLDFAYYAGLPRFSYGSSVGAPELPEKYYGAYRRYLGSMTEVGVREQSVADMLEKIVRRKVTKVADPCLLMPREAWDAFADRAELSVRPDGKGYILCYFVMNDERYWQYVSKVKEATGKQVIVLPMHTLDEEQPYDTVTDGTPYEFIRLIRDADFICTDSFHACAVSLIYEKDFYLLHRARKAEDAKYEDFLTRYGLKDRTVEDESRFIPKGRTDYRHAAEQLAEDRAFSLAFLKQTLAECGKA